MAKPIFIIRHKDRDLFQKSCDKLNEIKTALNQEYHVLVVYDEKTENDTDLEVLNADKIEPIELEKLKELLNVKPIEG